MIKVPNFREFYQTSSISIGKNDRLSMKHKAVEIEESQNFTHWLIVLEGDEINHNRIQWKVMIYPSELSGEFDYQYPYYVSSFFDFIHDAIEYTKQIERIAKQDQLSSVHN